MVTGIAMAMGWCQQAVTGQVSGKKKPYEGVKTQTATKHSTKKVHTKKKGGVKWGTVDLNGPRKFAGYVIDVQWDFMMLPFIENDANKTKLEKGRLAVADTGAQYLQAVQRFLESLWPYDMDVIFTQDWHPKGHMSFASSWINEETGEHPPLFAPLGAGIYKPVGGAQCPASSLDAKASINQVMWPDHCVQYTIGADIPKQLFRSGSIKGLKAVDNKNLDTVVIKGKNCGVDSYSGFLDNDGSSKTRSETVLHDRYITDLFVCGIATDYCVRASVLHAIAAGFNVHLIANICRGVAPETMIPALQEMSKAHGPNGSSVVIYIIRDLKDGGSVENLLKQAKVPYRAFDTTDLFFKTIVAPYQALKQPAGAPISGAPKMPVRTGGERKMIREAGAMRPMAPEVQAY